MIRRRTRHAGSGHVELNVIPLIDVVFFLLVFYVISTSFDAVESVAIQRPESSGSSQVQGGFVPVMITKSEAIQIGPTVVELTGLADAVRAALDRANATRVVVIADREVGVGTVLKVMDACESGGATDVQIAANRTGN